ncbi:MAG: gamma-glutamyltransferase [Geopsychrobacter sp.]|nr:gamma-glutamyltransferase [Geopsychrobacter sp.]
MRHAMPTTGCLLGLILLALSGCGNVPLSIDRTPENATGRTEQQLVRAHSYLLVSANPYASRAGQQILRKGGSAIDAAIAINMVLTLVEPQSSGLGGGSFILYWDQQDQTLHSYDGRETAPHSVDADLFNSADKPLSFQQAVAGGRAVGVPGLLKNLELAHQKHGRLPWAQLFAPAIKLAENGFIVSPRLSKLLQGDARRKLQRNAQARNYFYPHGEPLTTGQKVKNPQLAATLRLLATQGSKAFYQGEIARQITKIVQQDANPGQLRRADLISYRALERKPLCAPFYDYQVCGMGPPTSGGLTLLQMLTLLQATGIDKQQAANPQAIHLFAQAGRLAFADRAAYIADPDFIPVPVQGLLDPDYLKRRASLIDPQHDSGPVTAGHPPELNGNIWSSGYNPEQPGTSHMSIIDRYGNALSQTASIEQGFGCGLMVAGFLLNNELTDFSFAWKDQQGKPIANRVEGGKRPRSSMAPTMVFDHEGRLKMVIGSPGGSRIIPYVAQTIVSTLIWQQDIQTAINQPHYLHRNGAMLELEADTALAAYQTELMRRGYHISMRQLNSGLHGIFVEQHGYSGGADPRREGLVLGE